MIRINDLREMLDCDITDIIEYTKDSFNKIISTNLTECTVDYDKKK